MNVHPTLASLEYFASILLVLTIAVHAQIIYMEMGSHATKPLKIFMLKEKIPQKLERIKQYVDKHVAKIWSVWHPIFASASLVMLVITVRQLYADLIAKTMENALSPMSVNVYQVTVAPLVKKHTVNHPVKMEARAWPEISVPAPMVL